MKLALVLLSLCGAARAFDSPEATALDALIPDGRIRSQSVSETAVRAEIRAQLRYLVGNLFGVGSPALGHSLEIEITSRDRRDYRYRARFLMAWDTVGNPTPPAKVSVVVPASGDAASLARFDRTYGSRCGDPGSPLWYGLWHAGDPRCPLSAATPPSDARRLEVRLAPSPLNSTGKSPEFDRIWEDGRLVVAFVGGNTDSFRRSTQVEDLVEQMEANHGKPLAHKRTPYGRYVLHEAEFATFAGRVLIRGFDLVTGNIQQADQNFKTLFGRNSREADLVAYNGHSSYGANVRAFTAMARFDPGRYYVYWINSCKPFAHLDDALFRGVAAANPGEPVSRHLDVMSVVNIGDFGVGGDVYQLIQGILQKRTYYQLLYWLASGQPAVFHEHDNP